MIQKAEVMGCTQGKEWFSHFIEGWMSVESDGCSGRRHTNRNQLMIDKVCSAMVDNRRITESSLKSWALIWFGTFHSEGRFVHGAHLSESCPNLLTVEQNETRLAVARDLLQCADKDTNFIMTVITGDESSVYGYGPETKTRSSQ
jgi:hypothetical protein